MRLLERWRAWRLQRLAASWQQAGDRKRARRDAKERPNP